MELAPLVLQSNNRLLQNILVFMTFCPNLNFHTFQHPLLDISIPYVHSIEGSMSVFKVIGRHRFPNL